MGQGSLPSSRVVGDTASIRDIGVVVYKKVSSSIDTLNS